jgi:hypothetical protein
VQERCWLLPSGSHVDCSNLHLPVGAGTKTSNILVWLMSRGVGLCLLLFLHLTLGHPHAQVLLSYSPHAFPAHWAYLLLRLVGGMLLTPVCGSLPRRSRMGSWGRSCGTWRRG